MAIKSVSELERAAFQIRKNLLKLCSIQKIHIGGDLSIADVMTVLWQYQMKYDPNNINDEKRDRFVLSKGHASAVTSFNQAAIGCFSAEDVINEYATDEGRFSMHSCNLVNPYVEVSTGSLGHGFPVACGMAAALRLKENYQSRVYVVMGDGESVRRFHLGSCYECCSLSLRESCSYYRFQWVRGRMGTLKEITGLGNIADKYHAFGWNVIEINGNDISEIKNAFDSLPDSKSEIPSVLVCHTIKWQGCPIYGKIKFFGMQVR